MSECFNERRQLRISHFTFHISHCTMSMCECLMLSVECWMFECANVWMFSSPAIYRMQLANCKEQAGKSKEQEAKSKLKDASLVWGLFDSLVCQFRWHWWCLSFSPSSPLSDSQMSCEQVGFSWKRKKPRIARWVKRAVDWILRVKVTSLDFRFSEQGHLS